MRTTLTPTGDDARVRAAEEAVAGLGKAVGSLRCAGSQRLVRLGISMTHFHVLTLLRHHDAMPMGRLAEILDASMSSTTGIIDRMEERGLVERVRVPDDRRVVLVRPTQTGLDVVDEAELVKSDIMHAALGRLSLEQLERLAFATGDLQVAIEAEIASAPDRYADGALCSHANGDPSARPRPAGRSAPRPTCRDRVPHPRFHRRLTKGPSLEAMPMGHDEAPTHGLGALDLSQRAKMEILLAILLGLFLGALDQTIVAVALPTIITDLGGQELYTWTVTIYLLTSTITVPFYGKLSDLYGRKPLLMIGITLFLIGSALSGLSQNMTELILFRGIQGLGAGALFPISLAVIGDLFTPAERGKYQGLFGAVFGLSSIIGPLLGGFLTEHVSWHWIFYVNIPIGIVALAVIARLLPTVKRPDASRNLDFLGAGVFIVAVGSLLDRPDQQAVGRLGHVRRRWPDPDRAGAGRCLRLRRVAGQGADRSAGPVAEPDLRRRRSWRRSW